MSFSTTIRIRDSDDKEQEEAAEAAEAAKQIAEKKAANRQAEQNAIKKICLSGLCSFDNLPHDDINDPFWEELKVAGELTSPELVALKVLKMTYHWWKLYSANSPPFPTAL
jgi:hypothetical protein